MTDADPAQAHPRLQPRTDGGKGGLGPDRTVIGWVPTHVLGQMPGNLADYEPRINEYQAALATGQGFEYPIMIEYNYRTRYARVGEGNHRVAAALRAQVSHLPARCIRSLFRNDATIADGGRPMLVTTQIRPWPWTDEHDHSLYVPPEFHPIYLFPDTLVPAGTLSPRD